jgi:hypothetical protein
MLQHRPPSHNGIAAVRTAVYGAEFFQESTIPLIVLERWVALPATQRRSANAFIARGDPDLSRPTSGKQPDDDSDCDQTDETGVAETLDQSRDVAGDIAEERQIGSDEQRRDNRQRQQCQTDIRQTSDPAFDPSQRVHVRSPLSQLMPRAYAINDGCLHLRGEAYKRVFGISSLHVTKTCITNSAAMISRRNKKQTNLESSAARKFESAAAKIRI